MAYKKVWFGTAQKMQWIDAPVGGASFNPQQWGTSGTYLNGGGFAFRSQQSHQLATFEWRRSMGKWAAQVIHDYYDGVYGPGPFYFIDPLTYETNVLPKQVAFPGSNADLMQNAFVSGGMQYFGVTTPSNSRNLPVTPLALLRDTGPFATREIKIPRPDGYGVDVYAWFGNAVGGAEVRVNGTAIGSNTLTGAITAPARRVTTGDFVTLRLYMPNANSSISLYGFRTTMYRLSDTPTVVQTWCGGEGNSGLEFDGPPTKVRYNGVDGGQTGVAATFREVGSWLSVPHSS